MLVLKILCALVLTSSFCFADTGEDFLLSDGRLISNVKSFTHSPSNKELTVLDLTIGKDTLTDAMKKFGIKKIEQIGDAGSSLSFVCLKGLDGTLIAFQSGELGGKNHTILSTAIYKRSSKFKLEGSCKESRLVNKNMQLPFSLAIRNSFKEIQKKIGEPSKTQTDLLLYSYSSKLALNNKNYDVSCTIEISGDGDIPNKFYFSKIASY